MALKVQTRVATSIDLTGAAAAALISSTASASLGGLELWISDSTSTIGRVQVETGAVLQTFQVQGDYWDIAFSPEGILFGVHNGQRLRRIDTTTGVVTDIGDLGFSSASSLVFGADGTLYSASRNNTNLYRVDPLTGASTVIGNTGFEAAGDLAFNGSTLYMTTVTNQLVTINPLTGAAQVVGNLSVSDVLGLATASNGITYATAGTSIYSVNLQTAALTLISTYTSTALSQAFGTAFYMVPGPGSLALLGLGAVAVRRRAR